MNTQIGQVTVFGFDVNYYLSINPELPIEDANQKIDKIKHFKFINSIVLDIQLEPNQLDPKMFDYVAENKEYNIQDYGLTVEHLMEIVLKRLSSRVRQYLDYDESAKIEPLSNQPLPEMSQEWLDLKNKYMNNIQEIDKALIPFYIEQSSQPISSSESEQEPQSVKDKFYEDQQNYAGGITLAGGNTLPGDPVIDLLSAMHHMTEANLIMVKFMIKSRQQ